MGQVYRFLGLNTGLIQEEDMEVQERQKNYDADITYVTNSELGFDYLRDNMALNIKTMLFYAHLITVLLMKLIQS